MVRSVPLASRVVMLRAVMSRAVTLGAVTKLA